MADAKEIHALKFKMRNAVISYRTLVDSYDANCGGELLAHMVPAIAAAAKRVNEHAAALKAIDPQFPKDWVDFPTGDS